MHKVHSSFEFFVLGLDLSNKGRNFTTKNVNISRFSYAYHSGYGGVEENFLIPEPSNYNWLIENCHIKNTVTNLMLSETVCYNN